MQMAKRASRRALVGGRDVQVAACFTKSNATIIDRFPERTSLAEPHQDIGAHRPHPRARDSKAMTRRPARRRSRIAAAALPPRHDVRQPRRVSRGA